VKKGCRGGGIGRRKGLKITSYFTKSSHIKGEFTFSSYRRVIEELVGVFSVNSVNQINKIYRNHNGLTFQLLTPKISLKKF
jgi:hypothetical protein